MSNTAWLEDMFAAIDAQDAERFTNYLSEDAIFRFGNGEPVHGRAAAGAAVSGFFTTVRALRHDLAGVWAAGDVLSCHGEVTYTRHDGSEVMLPFANIMRMKGQHICEYLIFADTSPLFASD